MSVEKVVATMLIPNNHQGMFLPARKNDLLSLPAFFDAQTPMNKVSKKYAATMYQSNEDNIIVLRSLVQTKNGFVLLPLTASKIRDLDSGAP